MSNYRKERKKWNLMDFWWRVGEVKMENCWFVVKVRRLEIFMNLVEFGEEENRFGEVEEDINSEKGKSDSYVMASAMELMTPAMSSDMVWAGCVVCFVGLNSLVFIFSMGGVYRYPRTLFFYFILSLIK